MNKGENSIIKKILNIPVENFFGGLFFISIFFIVILQILSREVIYFLNHMNINITINPPVWTEEAARWSWVWLVFITLGSLEKTGGHLKVVFLADKLPEKTMTILNVILDIVYLAIIFIIFKFSIEQTIRGMSMRPVTLPFTDMWLFIVLPISLVFVVIRVIVRIIDNINNIMHSKKGDK